MSGPPAAGAGAVGGAPVVVVDGEPGDAPLDGVERLVGIAVLAAAGDPRAVERGGPAVDPVAVRPRAGAHLASVRHHLTPGSRERRGGASGRCRTRGER